MKTYLIALIALLLCGCGATDTTTFTTDRGNVAIIDYQDDPSVELPDDPAFTGETSEYGSTNEAWVSDRYHGQSDGPCYGPNSAGKECVFPPYKQINVVWNTGSAVCSQNVAYITTHGGTTQEALAIMEQLQAGINSVSGVGSGVVIHLNNASGTNMAINADCEHAASEFGEFSNTYGHSQVVNLPSSGGVDPGNAVYELPASSFLAFSPENIWAFITATIAQKGCGYVTVGNPVRLAKLKEFAFHTARHEVLHMLGFSHFASGMMNPGEGCNDPASSDDIPPGFGLALSDYSGGAGGTTINTGSIPASNLPVCPKGICP